MYKDNNDNDDDDEGNDNDFFDIDNEFILIMLLNIVQTLNCTKHKQQSQFF